MTGWMIATPSPQGCRIASTVQRRVTSAVCVTQEARVGPVTGV